MPLLLHAPPWMLISLSPRAPGRHGRTPAYLLVRRPQVGGLTSSDHVVLFPELERQRGYGGQHVTTTTCLFRNSGERQPAESHRHHPSVTRTMVAYAVTGTLFADRPINLAFAEITAWLLRRWMDRAGRLTA